jgi:hypothetical protein
MRYPFRTLPDHLARGLQLVCVVISPGPSIRWSGALLATAWELLLARVLAVPPERPDSDCPGPRCARTEGRPRSADVRHRLHGCGEATEPQCCGGASYRLPGVGTRDARRSLSSLVLCAHVLLHGEIKRSPEQRHGLLDIPWLPDVAGWRTSEPRFATGHFFGSRAAAAAWLEVYPEGMLDSVDEDFEIHRRVLEQLGWSRG